MSNFVNGHRARGFTLTEMIIALCVIGILISLAVPSFSSVFRKHKLANQTNDLHAAINLARSEAMKRHATVAVLPTGGVWSNGWTVVIDKNENKQVDPDEVVLLRRESLSPTTHVTNDTTPGYISYSPDGIPRRFNHAFFAATITLCDSGMSRSLIIAKWGRIRLAAGTC